jgi:glyoxylase-like metal-dependent hydrolase (beta-lactamase superfamily II)
MDNPITASLPVAEFWYAVEYCDNGILRLREAWIDPYLAGNIWLVRGRDRDLLIDSGTGIVSPRPVVEAIVAGKPLLAVALNSFYDHAGGLHFFDDRACHRLAAAAIADPTPKTSLSSIYVRDAMLRALPHAGFRAADYVMRGAPPTRLLADGDVIDLGDRSFQVLHLPGVWPDCIGLWEAATGGLFTGDALYDDPDAARRFDPRDRAAFRDSLRRMQALPVRAVYPGHFDRFDRARLMALADRIEREQASA